MFDKDHKTDLGPVKIHNQVIRSIATQATKNVSGVKQIGAGAINKLFHWLGSERPHMGIGIDFKPDNEIKLKIPIVVGFGVDIPSVATMVQEEVKGAIEKMTGVSHVDVTVIVQDVEKEADS